jgi:hypothetical protein
MITYGHSVTYIEVKNSASRTFSSVKIYCFYYSWSFPFKLMFGSNSYFCLFSIWNMMQCMRLTFISCDKPGNKTLIFICLYVEDRPGAVVKSSHWCQEVLGSSSLSAIVARVRLAWENPPGNPTLLGASYTGSVFFICLYVFPEKTSFSGCLIILIFGMNRSA